MMLLLVLTQMSSLSRPMKFNDDDGVGVVALTFSRTVRGDGGVARSTELFSMVFEGCIVVSSYSDSLRCRLSEDIMPVDCRLLFYLAHDYYVYY
jgi:hypothetical protein